MRMRIRGSCWMANKRINALTSMFTAEGRYGTFFLHMTTDRKPPGPTSSRSTKDRALSYIAWRDKALEPAQADADSAADTEISATPIDPLLERDRHSDLSRWLDWAEDGTGDRASRVLAELSGGILAAEILHDIDACFATVLPPAEAIRAAERLTRLLRA